jgi:hypothetical protein
MTGWVAFLSSQKTKMGRVTTPPMTIIAGMAGLCQVVVAYEPPARTIGTTYNRHNWIRATDECEGGCTYGTAEPRC